MAFDLPAGDECGVLLDDSSVHRIGSRNLADVPRVRHQSLCVSRRQVRGVFYDPNESRMWRIQKERQ